MQDFVIEGNVLVKYNGNAETVIVPEGIKEIGKECFRDNTTLRKVYLPKVESGCVHVNFRAFTGCNLQFIRGHAIGFTWGALDRCSVRDIYGDFVTFDDTSLLRVPKTCRVHSGNSEYSWKIFRDHNITWVADWKKIVAMEKDAEAKAKLPALQEELKRFRKKHRKTIFLNKVLTTGSPSWLRAIIFLAIAAITYLICRDMEALQLHYLRYLVPVAAGLLSLLLLRMIRLVWKKIRFHNRSSDAFRVQAISATLEDKIKEHQRNLLTPLGLQRLDEDVAILQNRFKMSGFSDIQGSSSLESFNAYLRASYGLPPESTPSSANDSANSKGLATGLAD